jgi:hypothetical protein
VRVNGVCQIVEHTAHMRGSVFVLVISVLAACGGGSGGADAAGDDGSTQPDAVPAPPFRNPVGLPDDELALEALKILGANVPGADTRCNGCHPLTRSHIRYWRTLSDTSLADCLTDLAVSSSSSAHQMVDCFRTDPSNPSANFNTPKIGVFASAARLPWFQHLFAQAYPGSTAEYDAFVMRVGMPPGASPNAPMTQPQFDIVAEWFIRGTPMLDQTLPEDPPPTTCFPNISPAVAAHVAEQATEGWRGYNAAASLNMYDCAGATDPRQCLTNQPLASSTSFGAGWDVNGATNRILYQGTPGDGYSSAYWTRSSADGRFVGHGDGAPGSSSTVIDLQDDSLISIASLYDPGFFPDNSGFIFQGGSSNVCAQSVLVNAGASVSMTEPGCSSVNSVGLYEHPGGVIGGDYFSVDGEFESDNGGHVVTLRDPAAWFGGDGDVDLVPMIWTGSQYQAKPQVSLDVPYQGDAVISPSSDLVLTRLSGPNDRQLGFVMFELTKTPNATSYDVEMKEVARYCLTGGKPAFSYDERWLVYHHYISASSDEDAQELGFANAEDPGYATYASRGAANVFLVEIATGARHRLTHMRPGQYALYPHFRSDGWIYYQVRDIGMPGGGDETEHTAANDGALVLE